MKILKLTCCLVLAVVSGIAEAQAGADLRGEVIVRGGNTVPPGTIARVVLTATNFGPDATPRAPGMAAAFTPNVGFRKFAIVPVPETAPCELRYIDFVAPPGQLSSVGASISTQNVLEPSESVTCVVGLITYPESPAEQIVNFGFAPTVGDPDPVNNIVGVLIRTGVPPAVARPIPVSSTSTISLVMLTLGIGAFGAASMRRLSR
jgi:hypothetical protein